MRPNAQPSLRYAPARSWVAWGAGVVAVGVVAAAGLLFLAGRGALPALGISQACQEKIEVLARLKTLRSQVEALKDPTPEELHAYAVLFAEIIEGGAPLDPAAYEDPEEIADRKVSLSSRLDAAEALDTTGAYANKIATLRSRIDAAEDSGELDDIEYEVYQIEIALGISTVAGTTPGGTSPGGGPPALTLPDTPPEAVPAPPEEQE